MNTEEIKNNYKNYEDSKLISIVKKDLMSLRPEVIDILKNEIVKRKLNSDLISEIDYQIINAQKLLKKSLEKRSFKGYLGMEIVRLNSDSMEIMLHSGYSSLLILVKILTKSMRKLKVDFTDIKSISKGNEILNDRGYIIKWKSKEGKEFEKLTLLHLLGKSDRQLLFDILGSRNIIINEK